MDHPVGRPDRLPVIVIRAVCGVHHLARARSLLAATSAQVGLPDDRINGFTIALNEIATNAILHAGGSATIIITISDTALTVEVRDRGTGMKPRPVAPGPTVPRLVVAASGLPTSSATTSTSTARPAAPQ